MKKTYIVEKCPIMFQGKVHEIGHKIKLDIDNEKHLSPFLSEIEEEKNPDKKEEPKATEKKKVVDKEEDPKEIVPEEDEKKEISQEDIPEDKKELSKPVEEKKDKKDTKTTKKTKKDGEK